MFLSSLAVAKVMNFVSSHADLSYMCSLYQQNMIRKKGYAIDTSDTSCTIWCGQNLTVEWHSYLEFLSQIRVL